MKIILIGAYGKIGELVQKALLPGQRVRSDRAEIIVICSTIIGALLLSRAVSTPELAAEILSSAEEIVVGLVKQGLPAGIVPEGDHNC